MWNRNFLLFIVLFAYIQSVYTRISVRQEINAYTFTPESAIGSLIAASLLFLILLFFIKKWQRSEVFSTKELLKIFGTSLFVYMLVMQFSGLLIAFTFDNIERNFNRQTFILSLFSDFLNGVIYGSFFLVYYYYNRNKTHQQKLSKYNVALSESRINQLKAQLNPHFLFNNLNILDQLIEEDKTIASDFLNEFAEIYRYVLQATDKELISITEELDFALQYFKLIHYKYGDAYQLNVEKKNVAGSIVPMTLQLLIENAIQHNLGTLEDPVQIRVEIDGSVRVCNNIKLKYNEKVTSGRALANLQEQYRLLSRKPIEIHQTEASFMVVVPTI